ncbi:hypothetical protein EON63_19440 [archaeon]|nr:MAG: hypothetical protein EON63_19440 [archaeon]
MRVLGKTELIGHGHLGAVEQAEGGRRGEGAPGSAVSGVGGGCMGYDDRVIGRIMCMDVCMTMYMTMCWICV